MFGLSYSSQLIQGSALKTWSCVSNIANLIWCKFHHFGLPVMPRSRRRHHSQSRSRSRSHSYDRDREPKRRKIDGYESPRHRRSLSYEEDTNDLAKRIENVKDESLTLKMSDSEQEGISERKTDSQATPSRKTEEVVEDVMEESLTLKISESEDSQTTLHPDDDFQKMNPNDNACDADVTLEKVSSGPNKDGDSGGEEDSEQETSFSASFLSNADVAELRSKIKENIMKANTGNIMSPKNLEKRIESELRKEKRLLEREGRERKRQELKEEKIRQKQEKEEQRKKELEAKQKEKELKEEKKKKEREEKEKKRKEKEEMDELKKKEREQEKIKKQQEMDEKNKEKQKLEERKQKTAAVFASFFKKKANSGEDVKQSKDSDPSPFMPFEVKSDMRLAPLVRAELTEERKEALINQLKSGNTSILYLQELKNGKRPGKSSRTWIFDDGDDDVIVLEDAALGESILQEESSKKAMKMKAKFLKFHDNRRPAYYGTWRKKSKTVKPRRPLSQDKEVFDYEVDSDDDWEDEDDAGEVESLKGSDEEEKEASDNEYEVDNEFFVPHGHLSDDEINEEEDKPLSPESQKAHLKLLKHEFDEERRSKTMRIKPRIIGCVWQNNVKDHVDEAIHKFFEPFTVISLGPIQIKKRNALVINRSPTKKQQFLLKQKLDVEHVPAFLTLIHGNVRKRRTLVDEFLEYLRQKGVEVTMSKVSLGKQLKHLANWTKCPDEGPMQNKMCWYVSENVRKEYQLDLALPNNWNYLAKSTSDN